VGTGGAIKKFAEQYVQNVARFLTSFDFKSQYLWNRSAQWKDKKHVATFHPLLCEKNLVNFDPETKKVIDTHVDPPKKTFSEDYISALSWWRPLKFLHALQSPKLYQIYSSIFGCTFSRTWGAGRPQVGLCPIFLAI